MSLYSSPKVNLAAAYEILSSMAFVTGFLTIRDLQSDALRRKISAHLKEIMDDDETLGGGLQSGPTTWFDYST